MENEKVLVLRTCAADMTSHDGFKWPASGAVEAPDWNPEPVCGGGLHGLAWGEGDARLISWADDARWLVVSVAAADIVDLGGIVKFPRGEVVYCGNRFDACTYLAEHGAAWRAIVGGHVTTGDYGHATAGAGGHATAGNHGHATAGDYGHATAGKYGHATAGAGGHATAGAGGHATAGDDGTATAGDDGTATAGDGGRATTGDYGRATAGDYGHATAGDYGHATAGDSGTATARNYGHATAGDYGTATAGYCGHATAGDCGTIIIAYHDGERMRRLVGYVGEDGIEPNVSYRVEDGKFVRV